MPGGTKDAERPSRRAKKPPEYIKHGSWPTAVMKPHRGAQVAQAVARMLATAMTAKKLSANKLATESGINRQVITNILLGTSWPDLLTIATLEQTLEHRLWPDHLAWPESGDPEAHPDMTE